MITEDKQLNMNEVKRTFTDDLVGVLLEIHARPLMLQANTARKDAFLIAAAASEGLISTLCPVSKFPGCCWHLTPKGLTKLENY